jgi:hypothetical protein
LIQIRNPSFFFFSTLPARRRPHGTHKLTHTYARTQRMCPAPTTHVFDISCPPPSPSFFVNTTTTTRSYRLQHKNNHLLSPIPTFLSTFNFNS